MSLPGLPRRLRPPGAMSVSTGLIMVSPGRARNHVGQEADRIAIEIGSATHQRAYSDHQDMCHRRLTALTSSRIIIKQVEMAEESARPHRSHACAPRRG